MVEDFIRLIKHEPLHEKNLLFAYPKTKAYTSCMVLKHAAEKCLCFRSIDSTILWLYSPISVSDLVGNPEDRVYPKDADCYSIQ